MFLIVNLIIAFVIDKRDDFIIDLMIDAIAGMLIKLIAFDGNC